MYKQITKFSSKLLDHITASSSGRDCHDHDPGNMVLISAVLSAHISVPFRGEQGCMINGCVDRNRIFYYRKMFALLKSSSDRSTKSFDHGKTGVLSAGESSYFSSIKRIHQCAPGTGDLALVL